MLLFVLGYLAVAHGCLMFPENAASTVAPAPTSEPTSELTMASTIELWVLNNGAHTDLVLPVVAGGQNWRTVFPDAAFVGPVGNADLIAIGWGDAEFYLQTPSWAALRFSTAARALTGQNASLLHVQYLQRAQLPQQRYRLRISAAQYLALSAFVRSTLSTALPPATAISGARYGVDDAFFAARESYSAFNTCNVWTGRALRAAGVKASRWTPFPWLVTWYLHPENGSALTAWSAPEFPDQSRHIRRAFAHK
jgi:uncharacterized protein (TIGR02117 family)